MKKLLKNINIIIIAIIILLTTFLIGTPIAESNVQIIYIILGIFSIIYYFIRILKKEENSINKIDILISLLTFSTLIPLVFKTYVSLTETVHIILKYFSILSLYFIIKNECKNKPENIQIIINIIILSISILCVIGLDEINDNYLQEFKEIINVKEINNDEKRVMSLFSYPNTMATVAGIGIYLCLGQLFKLKNIKEKCIYILASILMLITIILTYSRLVYIIFTALMLVYLIILLKKYKIKRFINKKSIVLTTIILISLIIYIVRGLQISDNLEIQDNYQKILYTVESNKEYIFKFEIETSTKNQIKIIEKNNYFDEIKVTERVSVEQGTLEIPIHTTETTKVIYIYIENLDKNDTIINIKKAYINNEELILKYKLLPTKVVDKIQSINLNNKSVWERLTFIKDACKIIKDNWITGLGGNAWRTVQLEVQEYNYYAQEVHCYPIQIFLENGIIGFVVCVAIGIWLIISLIKKTIENEIDMQEISIFFAIVFLITHSLLDFDLSFFYVQLIISILIAILSSKIKEVKCNKFIKILYLIIIIVSLINIEVASVEKYYDDHSQVIVVNKNRTKQDIFEAYYKLLPFNKEIKMRMYEVLRENQTQNYEKLKFILKDIIETEKYDYSNIDLNNVLEYTSLIVENEDVNEDDVNYILKYIKETSEFAKYQPEIRITRWENLKMIAEEFQYYGHQEYFDILYRELEKEIKQHKENVLNIEKCRYEKEKLEEYKKRIEKIKP